MCILCHLKWFGWNVYFAKHKLSYIENELNWKKPIRVWVFRDWYSSFCNRNIDDLLNKRKSGNVFYHITIRTFMCGKERTAENYACVINHFTFLLHMMTMEKYWDFIFKWEKIELFGCYTEQNVGFYAKRVHSMYVKAFNITALFRSLPTFEFEWISAYSVKYQQPQ